MYTNRGRVTVENILILISKTVIAYFVFFIFLFSVPVYKELKAAFTTVYGFNESRLVIASASLFVDIADTPEERKRGLSGLENLKPGTGLYFKFDYPDFHGIWMKDMNFPIDIIWLDSSQRVVDIKKGASPDSYPEVFVPNREAMYVLEVPAGFVESEGIKVRDQVTTF
jgi:uncharacterized membrane protein (UPF0127 family)